MHLIFMWRNLLLSVVLLTFSAQGQETVFADVELSSPSVTATDASNPWGTLPQAPSQSKSEQEKEAQKKEQSERTFGIVPRFGTTDRMDAPPLTTGEKFHLFAKTTFDPVTVIIAAAQAGVSQADNQFAGYGQGAEGYGKRFGAAFGDQLSAGFFSNFLYPTIFKQDPRYFRRGHGGFGRRFVYSLLQQVVCHTDGGGRAFNASSVLGAFTSGGLSNIYYPADDRGFKLTMGRSGLAIAYASAGGLFSEFWPDIQRKLSRKPEDDKTPKGPAAAEPSANSK
jgi:hypothetical protein